MFEIFRSLLAIFSAIHPKFAVIITHITTVAGNFMSGSLAKVQAGERHKETRRHVKVD
jgi:hypothetical protein